MLFEREVSDLADYYSKRLTPTKIREILNSWMDRRPLNVQPELMEDLMVDYDRFSNVINSVLEYLRERDWRGAIVSIVGEYGSGKSQVGLTIWRLLKSESEVRAYLKKLDPISDVRSLLLDDVIFDDVTPSVLIVDEVDQLLGDLYKGKRERIEELADIVRAITEGSVSPPRGSVVLLMSMKARGVLAADRSLSNRLLARSREFRLSMTDDQRIRAAEEVVKKVMALYMALESSFGLHKHFDLIYDFLISRARWLALVYEIGGIVKDITLTLNEVLRSLDPDARVPSGTELGKALEDLLKLYLKAKASAIPLQVRVGDQVRHYMALFSDERMRTEGSVSDGQYVVHTYDPKRNAVGSPVSKVILEVKSGSTWFESLETKRQLAAFLELAPVMLIALVDKEPDDASLISLESSGKSNPLKVVIVDMKPFKLSLILRNPIDLLDSWVTLNRDLAEQMEYLMIPKGREVSSEGPVGLVEVAASAIVTSMLAELRRVRSYKKVSTLYAVITNALAYSFSQKGASPPKVTPTLLDSIIRVFVKEGLGRFSSSGKTVQVRRDNRVRMAELEYDLERRKRLEGEVADLIRRVVA